MGYRMQIRIPYTSAVLSISFKRASTDETFDEKLAILDDLSYQAVHRQLQDAVHSMVRKGSTSLGSYWYIQDNNKNFQFVENLLENNAFKKRDLNRVLDYAAGGFARSRKNTIFHAHDDLGVALIKALHEAGGELSPRAIHRIFQAEDKHSSPRGMKYIVSAGLIDEQQAAAYSKSAKDGRMKNLMSFAYGAQINLAYQEQMVIP